MRTLLGIVRDPARRPGVIDDCVATLDAEVAAKKGMMGAAVRTAYRAVGRLEGGRVIPLVVDKLLDEFAAAVDPFLSDYRRDPDAQPRGFGAYLAARSDAVADALLGVTDRERDRVRNPVLIATYNGLRGTAERLVATSVPGLGLMLERHVAP